MGGAAVFADVASDHVTSVSQTWYFWVLGVVQIPGVKKKKTNLDIIISYAIKFIVLYR